MYYWQQTFMRKFSLQNHMPAMVLTIRLGWCTVFHPTFTPMRVVSQLEIYNKVGHTGKQMQINVKSGWTGFLQC